MKPMTHPVSRLTLPALGAAVAWLLVGVAQAELIHRYSFDEAPGTGIAGDFYSGAPGTLSGGADFTGGGAVSFDGTSGYVDLPNGIISALTDASFEAWVTWGGGAGNWQRIFDFGTSLTGEGTSGTGSDYVFLTPRSSGGITRFGARASGETADNVVVDGPALPTNVLAHVAVTYDSVNLMAKLYLNGAFIAQQRATQALSSIEDVNNWLGRSQYSGDAYFNGLMHEFRIHNSVLSSPQVMANAAAGPEDDLADPGYVVAVQLQAPASVPLRGTAQATVFADFQGATHVNVTFGEGATFSSSDSGVVSVDASGLLRGEAPGQAEIVATYDTLSATSVVQVIAVHGAVLKHRYSFNESAGPTIVDSQGGADGTLVDPGSRCGFTGATLVLSNAANTASSSTSGSYVDLPNGLIHVLTNMTIETWVRFVPIAGNWMRVWDFGSSTGGEGVSGSGSSYVFLCPRTGGSGGSRFALRDGSTETVVADATQLPNAMTHVVVTYHTGVNTCRMYLNGAMVATRTAPTPLSVINDVNMWIGRSQWGGDAYFNGVFDELRIYEGTMSEGDVVVSRAAGPDALTAGAGDLVSVTVQALPVMRGGAQVGTILANYENVLGINVTTSSDTSLRSSDTNVIAIANGNVIVAVGPGQATVVATHAGVEGSQLITVEETGSVASLLVNRYSFDEGAGTGILDAVGGAHGAIVNPYNAVWTGTNLWLNNPNSTSATNAYVNLPNGIMSRHTNATVEMWVTWAGNFTASWQRWFDFGSSAQGEDSTGTGLTYFLLTPRSGGSGNRMRVTMSTNSNAGGAEQIMETATMAQNVETHIVVTYSTDNQAMALFVNGTLVSGAVSAVPLFGLKDFNNWLGRAQWNDPFLNGRFNEFRIYGGCLSASQVAANYAAGPDAAIELPAEILSQPSPATVGEGGTAAFAIAARGFPTLSYQWYRDGAQVSDATTPALSVPGATSNDDGAQFTCVVSNLIAGSPFVVTSAVATLTVVNAASSLVHRYSFNDGTADDSVGTAHGTLMNGIAINEGAAQFVAAANHYIDLPGHLIDGYPAITLEFWMSAGVNGAWSRVFDFGTQNASGQGAYYIMFTPHSGDNTARLVYSDADPGYNHEVFAQTAGVLDNAGPTHVACVFDSVNSTLVLYVNGVMAGIRHDFVFPLSSIVNTFSWLGRSLYNGDAWYEGSLDEFRIYNSALSAGKVWQSYQQGPNTVLNNDPITIAKQPENTRVKAGGDATFSVTAFGALQLTPLTYEWRFGGADLADGTNATLTLAGVQAGAVGAYDVVIRNSGGSVTSTVATLTLNLPPTAVDQTVYTATNTVLSFAASSLLAGATDPEGDALTVTAVSDTSTNNGTVTLADGVVTYTPPADVAGTDAFSYTVTDALGDTTTGQVVVHILAAHPGGKGVSAVPGGGVALVTFIGIPGFTYTIERTLAVPGGWEAIGTATADATGTVSFTDPNPPAGMAFYRLLKQ
ncbi:MAG: cadherin-like domain-containing protein [Verrucomicrobia bacterium]|nr:cadherin-like domain-containing protein [Verrucomicrobiota bacterium]